MTDNHKDEYAGKTDHEVILILESQVQNLMTNLTKTEKQNDRLTKTQGQISVVRMVFMGVILLFMGVILLIGGMVMMSVVSWWSPKGTIGIEKELAFFERLLLVLLGILGSATVALYDQRSNGKDGNG